MTPLKSGTRTTPEMVNPVDQETINVHSRVTALEAGMDRLTQDVQSLANVMREQSVNMSTALDKAVRDFRTELSQLGNELTKVKIPNVTLWASVGAFVFTLVTATMGIFLAPLYMNQSYYAQNLIQHKEYIREKLDDMSADIKERTQQVSINTRAIEALSRQDHLLDVKVHYERELDSLKFSQQERSIDILKAKLYPELSSSLKQTSTPPTTSALPPEPPLDF